MVSLKERYQKEIKLAIMKEKGYKNPMQVPRLLKIVINRGVGEGKENPKAAEVASAELALITGQKPALRRAKKSIAGFKLKGKDPIGLMVTLRKNRMYDFFEKLVNMVLPKIRDFKGVDPASFDGKGNYSLGIREQLVFPEVDYDKVDKIRGMDVTFVTSAKKNEEAKILLEYLGMPFRRS